MNTDSVTIPNSKEKSFFAGQEEIFARIVSLVISILFFIIYATAKDKIELKWDGLFFILVIFWLVYEFLSISLFQFFTFFSKKKSNKVNKIDTVLINNDLASDEPRE